MKAGDIHDMEQQLWEARETRANSHLRAGDYSVPVARQVRLDCRKEQQTQATVGEALKRLPRNYTRPLFAEECDAIYQYVFEGYWDDSRTAYRPAA